MSSLHDIPPTAMASSVGNPSLFLNLPDKVRQNIYKQVFNGSSITLVRRPYAPGLPKMSVWTVENYPTAISLTSHSIWDESIYLLDQAITVVLPYDLVQHLDHYVNRRSLQLKNRVKHIRYLSCLSCRNLTAERLLLLMSKLEAAEYCVSLIGGSQHVPMANILLRLTHGSRRRGASEYDPYYAHLKKVTSLEKFVPIAENWVKRHHKRMISNGFATGSKILLIGPYYKPKRKISFPSPKTQAGDDSNPPC